MKKLFAFSFTFLTLLQALPAMALISVYNEDGFAFPTERLSMDFSPEKTGFRLASIPPVLFSDHEMMLITGDFKALSYNILEKMELNTEWKYFNNGFMQETETESDYLARLERIVQRIAAAAIMQGIEIICLQEVPGSELSADDHVALSFKELLEQHLSNFERFHQGNNMILVNKHINSMLVDLNSLKFAPKMLFKKSNLSKAMAVYIEERNTVIINQHASWMSKEDESGPSAPESDVIAGFNLIIEKIARDYSNSQTVRVQIYGDFNRENYQLADEFRTLDIGDFASQLNISEFSVLKANDYTNIRYFEAFPAVLTSSDYLIDGKIGLK